MVERAPPVAIADLKPGDAIIVSSTVGAASDQMTRSLFWRRRTNFD